MENMTSEKIIQLLIAKIEQEQEQKQIVIDTLSKEILLLKDKLKEKDKLKQKKDLDKKEIIYKWFFEDLHICENQYTTYNEIKNIFSDWYVENYSEGHVDYILIKRELIRWQRNSQFGFTEKNGNERHPRFNLIKKQE